jgi:hypothetical protein
MELSYNKPGTYHNSHSSHGKITPFQAPITRFPLQKKPRKTLRLNPVQKICNLRLVWQNIQILSPNSDPQSCVSFDREPTLTCHGRDRLRKGHWRPFKQGSKIDGYLRTFSLNSRNLRIFWNDGERISRRIGILS